MRGGRESKGKAKEKVQKEKPAPAKVTKKLAFVATVATVKALPNNSQFDIVNFKDLPSQIIAATDLFKPNDKGIFFEPDALIPERFKNDYIPNEILVDEKVNKGYYVQNLVIEKHDSQGLFIPSSAFDPDEFPDLADTIEWSRDGFDLSRDLEIKAYDKPVEKKQSSAAPSQSGKPLQVIPQHFPKSIQKAQNFFTSYKDDDFEIVTKLDGLPFSLCWYTNEFRLYAGAKKINFNEDKPDSEFGTYLQRLGIVQKLKKHNQNIAIIGEFVGPGIADNREKFEEQEYYISEVWDIDSQRFLDYNQKITFLTSIFGHSNHLAPIIDTNKILSEYTKAENLEEYVNTVKINGTFAKGIVCTLVRDRTISFFVDSDKYAKKHKK